MAIREYKCPTCGLTEEIILQASQIPDPHGKCSRCSSESNYVEFSTFSLARSSFQEAPDDIMIGRDSEARWKVYQDRIDERNKVRKETGSLGLTLNEGGAYEPVSDDTRKLRMDSLSSELPQGNDWNPVWDNKPAVS